MLKCHHSLQNWEWPLMWEGMFSLLQLNFTAEVAPMPPVVEGQAL